MIDGLRDEQLLEHLRPTIPAAAGRTVAQRLVEEAVLASGRDNTTAQVIEVL